MRSLLSALYGYFDLEGNERAPGQLRATRRRADDRPTACRRSTEILGSAAGPPIASGFDVEPQVPLAPPRTHYVESGTRTERISDNLPVYQGPDFRNEAAAVPLPSAVRGRHAARSAAIAVHAAARQRPVRVRRARARVPACAHRSARRLRRRRRRARHQVPVAVHVHVARERRPAPALRAGRRRQRRHPRSTTTSSR